MKTINIWYDLGGRHQSGISCYKHLPESSKSAARNVYSPVCHHGGRCHFVYKLEWGPRQKATKLPVFALIGRSNQIFSAILIASSYVLGLTTADQTICGHPYTELYGGMLKVSV